jgi:hypothetical protein
MRAFAHLFDARPSGPNPHSILCAAPEFASARQGINEAVAGDFAAAREAARALEEYRKIFEFGRTWDGDAYAAQPRGLAEVRPAAGARDRAGLRRACALQQAENRFGRPEAVPNHPERPQNPQIRRDLVVQRSWKGLLERMKTGLVVGCLQVRRPAAPGPADANRPAAAASSRGWDRLERPACCGQTASGRRGTSTLKTKPGRHTTAC